MLVTSSSGQQQLPVRPRSEPDSSQLLVEAAARGDLETAMELIAGDPFADVNLCCGVLYRGKRADVIMKEEAATEVRIEYEEFRSDLSALFLAAHHGLLPLLYKLLNMGADVNQKHFHGYATTAAVREGREDVLEILIRAGANQDACEDALLEASCHGKAKLVGVLMESDFIRPNVAVHALVLASSRGFVDVVDILIKCGVNANATARVLLCSLKPSLHANLDCTPLVAAVVNRQVAIVRQLLQSGVRTDTKVGLGAWSWDTANGEEFRVGAGLAEPYSITWCAVEYFESTGTILTTLLNHISPNTLHCGRSLLHHSILCSNPAAAETLLSSGADYEMAVTTTSKKYEFRPVHMAARLGQHEILQHLCNKGCNPNARTESGETALMLCTRYKRKDCLRVLLAAGADLGIVNNDGTTAESIAAACKWKNGFRNTILDAIRSGTIPKAGDSSFSPVMFVAACGNVLALEVLMKQPDVDIDEKDKDGFTPIMVAAREGHVDAFRLLLLAGANTAPAIPLCKSELFEQALLEFTLENGNTRGFYALHYAARVGDVTAVRILAKRSHDVNLHNTEGYTPLMLAAREGHSDVCELLIANGAICDKTVLSLATKRSMGIILDEMARLCVTCGEKVRKHTKNGKGRPHRKVLTVVEASGILRWGKSKQRNVVCREAELGGSLRFQNNRRRKGDALAAGLFRIVTTEGKEFHFVCDGGDDAAELWVRGITNATKAAAETVLT